MKRADLLRELADPSNTETAEARVFLDLVDVYWTVQEKGEFHLGLADKDRGWAVWIKADGCFELTRVHNDGSRDSDMERIHICDLGELIERLQEMRSFAKAYFGTWPHD